MSKDFYIRKQTKRKNFSEDVRLLFLYNYECWVCGSNRWNALHHILGANHEENGSVLNACPICNEPCHIGGGHYFSEDQKKYFLNKTLEYLKMNGYKLKEVDKQFIKINKKYYEA